MTDEKETKTASPYDKALRHAQMEVGRRVREGEKLSKEQVREIVDKHRKEVQK